MAGLVLKRRNENAMDNAMVMNFMVTNMLYIVGGLGILVIVMYIIIINL